MRMFCTFLYLRIDGSWKMVEGPRDRNVYLAHALDILTILLSGRKVGLTPILNKAGEFWGQLLDKLFSRE